MGCPIGARRRTFAKRSCLCLIAVIASLGSANGELVPPVYPLTPVQPAPQAPVSDLPPQDPPSEPVEYLIPLRFNGRSFAEEERPVERNLCRRSDTQCQAAFRIDVLVHNSTDGRSGTPVWAPLCFDGAGKATTQLQKVADAVCRQVFKLFMESRKPRKVKGTSASPFVMPKGRVSGANKFDPAHYSHWVTIVGGVQDDSAQLQDMELQVSTKPCTTNRLFALESCSFYYF